MDNLSYKYLNTLPNICCTLVARCRHYMNLMQIESNRLSMLENDCNLSLDQFYALKKDLDFYINSALTIKIMNIANVSEAESSTDLVEEFSDYALAVWQVGSAKLVGYGKNAQYISLTDRFLMLLNNIVNRFHNQDVFIHTWNMFQMPTCIHRQPFSATIQGIGKWLTMNARRHLKHVPGRPLTAVLQGIQEHIEEASTAISNISSHPFCSVTLYAMTTEIANDYQQRFSTADACLRQYVYLKNSISFLTNLKHLIEMYMICPNNYSIKNFFDELVNGIIPTSNNGPEEDSETMKTFRYVVDLLTGKLLGDNYLLDQNSLIQPVVSSDKTLKKNQLVKEMADWLLSHYNTSIINESIQYFDEKPCNFYINHTDGHSKETPIYGINTQTDVQYSKYDVSTVPPVLVNQLQLTNPYEMVAPHYDGTYTHLYFQEAQQPSDFTALYLNQNYGRLNFKEFSTTRKGRRVGSTGSTKQMSNVPLIDLQPIKIPKLKMDLLKPLT